MGESLIIRLRKEDVYHHLIALCQNDDLFSISDYRKDIQEQDFERIIISDTKLIKKNGDVQGAVIGTIRLLPNNDKTTAMFVDKDAIWNNPIPKGGKRLFTQFFKRVKKHFKELSLLEELPNKSNSSTSKKYTTYSDSDQSGTNKTQFTIAAIGAIAVIIAACIGFMGNIVNAFAPPAIEVASTKILATSTVAVCPPNLLIPVTSTPTPPSLIVIIIDLPNENSYLLESKDLIKTFLPNTLDAGDKVVLINTGKGSGLSSITYSNSIQISDYPTILIPPTPYLISTTPTFLVTPVTDIQIIEATSIAHIQSTAIEATARQVEFESDCANQEYLTQSVIYKSELEKLKKDFVTDLINNIDIQNTASFQGQITDGLSVANDVISSQCSRYSDCKLIVFSDFGNSYANVEFYPNVDLSRVGVLSILLNCNSQSICQDKIDSWKQIFGGLGSKNIEFVNILFPDLLLISEFFD